MKKVLEQVFTHRPLGRQSAKSALLQIASGEADPAQMAALMAALRMRGPSVDELLGFKEALLECCIPIDLEGRQAIDLCGTGGDGKDTFNISTLAAFVVAGAGFPVLKHSNYGQSSPCGSSNVMEELGYRFPQNAQAVLQQLDEVGIAFIHAPLFHPALKAVGQVRKGLGLPTFFNMLGPLVNPARPPFQMVGVFDLRLCRMYQYLFEIEGRRHYSILHSLDGYDEVSLIGTTKVLGPESEEMLQPRDFGFEALLPSQILGGKNPKESAAIFLELLQAKAEPERQAVVIANAALAIRLQQPALSLLDAAAIAKESLQSGRAFHIFQQLIQHKIQ